MTATPPDASDQSESSPDAASFIRRHAGEHEPDLTAAQRDLLGRVIARRIAQGAKLALIARAAATALPELGEARARRLGRDETLRAHAWEDLARLRASGVDAIALSAARDACPACRAAAGSPSPAHGGGGWGAGDVLPIPIAGCTHASGCRCRYIAYIAESDVSPALAAPLDAAADGNADGNMNADPDSPPLAGEGLGERSTRPWYRPRPPRPHAPHGPRWTDAERAARHPARPARPKRRPRP